MDTYKQGFEARLGANFGPHEFDIEKQFIRASELWELDGGEFYRQLIDLVAWLFSRLDSQLGPDSWHENRNPYSLLAEAIQGSDQNSKHTIVSFNYDCWLEKSLFLKNKLGQILWLPRDGYNPELAIGVIGYLGPADRSRARNQQGGVPHSPIAPSFFSKNIEHRSRTRVLKPHGSLSWVHSKQNRRLYPLVLLDADNVRTGPLGVNVAHLEDGIPLPNIQLHMPNSDKAGEYQALIIPPAPIKTKYGPIFWEINKNIQEELNHCDAVVVIGWSMPTTDKDSRDDIFQVIRSRHTQLKDLIVCQKDAPQSLFAQFEQMFWPANPPQSWNSGFGKDFIKQYLEPMLLESNANE